MNPFLSNDSAWILLAALWTLPWKGVALWTAARRGDQKWFIALLIINTLGLLEILYIFVFSKRLARLEHEKKSVHHHSDQV